MGAFLERRDLGLGTRSFFFKRDAGLGTRDSGFVAIGSFREKSSVSILKKALINCHSRLRGNDGFIVNESFSKSNFVSQKKRISFLHSVLRSKRSSNTLEHRFSSPESRVPTAYE